MQAAIGIASSLLALGAYVYLLGGFVLWLKFTAARLPTDDAVGALDGNRMLAVGLKALVFELVLIAGLLALAFIAWEAVRFRDVQAAKKRRKQAVKAEKEIARDKPAGSDVRQDAKAEVQSAEQAVTDAGELDRQEKLEAWRRLLQALIVAILVGSIASGAPRWFWSADPPPWFGPTMGALAAILWLLSVNRLLRWARSPPGRRRALKTRLTVVAAVLAVSLLAAPAGVGVLVLLLFLHLSHHLKELPKVPDAAHLVPAVLIVAGCLSLVVAMYLATPPVSLDNAIVVLDGEGRQFVQGGYVGRSDDGVYLAVCNPEREDPKESGTTHLRVISSKDTRRIILGGESGYVFDDGKDPSLMDLAHQLLSRRPLDEKLDTVALDVRADALTCGFPDHLAIARRYRERRTARLWIVMKVPGEGTLTLHGNRLVPQRRHVAEPGWSPLRVEPRPRYRMAHKCEGPFATTVRVKFAPDGASVESEMTSVTLAGIWGRHRQRQAQACRRAWVHQRRAAAFARVASAVNAR